MVILTSQQAVMGRNHEDPSRVTYTIADHSLTPLVSAAAAAAAENRWGPFPTTLAHVMWQ